VPKAHPTRRLAVIRARCELDLFTAHSTPRTPLPKAVRVGQVSLKDVLPALGYLDSLAPADREQVVRNDRWLSRLAVERHALDGRVSKAVRAVAAHQAKLDPIRRHLERYLDTDKARSACERWLSDATLGYLDVSRDKDLLLWLEYLVGVGVPAGRIALRMPTSTHELVSSTNDLVAMALNCQLAIDDTDGDQGLPARYLQISSRVLDKGVSAPPAQMSMAGFHSLFLSANIALRMRT
jgi:hypothetical protein